MSTLAAEGARRRQAGDTRRSCLRRSGTGSTGARAGEGTVTVTETEMWAWCWGRIHQEEGGWGSVMTNYL